MARSFFIILLFLSTPVYAVEWCVDQVNGLDSNGGNSASTCAADDSNAWKTFQAVEDKGSGFADGDSVLFETGTTQEVTGVFTFKDSGSVGSLVTVTAFDTAGNWTETYPNVWRMEFNTYPFEIHLDSTEYEPANAPWTVNATDRWTWEPQDFNATAFYLYVYATSNPATAYSTMTYRDTSNHITIGKYGGGADPIFECRQAIADSWTDASGECAGCHYTTLSADPNRVWGDGTELRPADAKSGGSHNLGATYRWFWDSGNTRLYMQTASTDPHDEWTEIEGNDQNATCLDLSARTHLIVQNLDIRGGSTQIIKQRGATYNIIENNNIGYGRSGIFVQGGSSPSFVPNQHLVIRGNDIDHQRVWGEADTYDDMSGVAEAINVRSSLEDSMIYNNEFARYDHDGILLEARHGDLSNFDGVFDNKIFGNEFHATNSYDGRAYGFNGMNSKNTRNRLFYNTMHDLFNSPKLDGGPGNHVHHNLMYGWDNAQWGIDTSLDLSEGVTFICTDATFDSKDNIYEYNTMYDNESVCVFVDQQASSSCTKNGHIIRNNTFMDCGTAPVTAAYADIYVIVETGSNVDDETIIVKNNNIFKTGSVSTAELMRHGTTNYTIANFESQQPTYADNVHGDPAFVNAATPDFHLKGSSAALNIGINGLARFDYDGNPIGNGAPDAGAYEAPGAIKLKGVTLTGVRTN